MFEEILIKKKIVITWHWWKRSKITIFLLLAQHVALLRDIPLHFLTYHQRSHTHSWRHTTHATTTLSNNSYKIQSVYHNNHHHNSSHNFQCTHQMAGLYITGSRSRNLRQLLGSLFRLRHEWSSLYRTTRRSSFKKYHQYPIVCFANHFVWLHWWIFCTQLVKK